MMVLYAKLYYFYRTALVRSIRAGIFLILLFLILYYASQKMPPVLPQVLFNLFVILEVFFHYKVSKVSPSVLVSKNKGKDIFQSFTMPALYGFVTEQKTSRIIKQLLEYPQIQHVLEKANITHKELPLMDVDKDLFAKSSFDVSKTFKGEYVTTMDVLVSYLFLIEKETRLLFAKQLKAEDLYNIIYWARLEFPEEEHPKKLEVHFTGSGIGEAIVSGWTPETRKYTALFTNIALREKPLIRGREPEFKTMLEGLTKVESNNVLIVGDIGAGKENLVKALAYHSFEGNLGSYLNHRRVLQLLVGSLTAGTTNRSDLESRLQSIIAEISHANDVLLYIQDFQNIVGGSSYNLDLSGALLPYLKTGNLPVIATMTTGSFKAFMERNPLKEAFTVIHLKTPSKDDAIQMVMGDASKVEKKYKVILSYGAIGSAVEFADRFVQDATLPGSAMTLLENVANTISLAKLHPQFERTHRKMVLEDDVVKKVEETTHIKVSVPTPTEIQLLLHLEDKLHERVIAQSDAVIAIAEAMRRVRSGLTTSQRPISFLFLGPTGVGKTETAKALADLYFGGEKNMLRLDMSEYTDETGIKRLLGAPPGEGPERGELTDKIHDNPASLVLLDEFEKANPKIHNLFLQVLEDGRLTDNKGITVSFQNAIIIATSNAGSEFIREELQKGTTVNKAFQQKLLGFLQTNGIFKPELLNRFDDVITFKPLGETEVNQVIKLFIQKLTKTLEEQDIKLVIEDAVIERIAQEGFDKEFGARPLRRYIQDNIEDLIAQKKLTNELVRGKTATVAVNGVGALEIFVS